ncbi:MAG TPA: tetratricopeptide repeat protein [Anaerolineae bacterium]|nr:tetratricopeptide repeat protein [Anaerolineae bacterium]
MSRIKGRAPAARRPAPETAITLRLSPRRLIGSAALLVALVGGGAGAWRWSQRPPEPPRVDLSGAQVAVRGKVDAALAAIARDPGSAQAWGELGMVYQAHDFDAQAANCYVQAAALAPLAPRWPYLRALTLAEADPAAALVAMEQAKAIGAEGLAVDWHEGNLLTELGRPADAAAAFNRGLAHQSNSAPLLAGKGRLALQKGDVKQAITTLEQAVRADANWAESYALLAQAYGRAGRDDDSARIAELARAMQKQEQIGLADPVFLALVERGVSVRWLVRRGQIAMQANRVDEADKLFRQAIAADPATAAGYVGLGVTMQNRGDLAGAIGQYRLALEQEPENVEAMANLGLALARDQKAADGATILEEALRVAPGHLGASINLALIRLDQGQGDAALRIADSALSLQPTNTQLLETRAKAFDLLGQPDAAQEAWKALGSLAPSDPNAVAQQAAAAMAAGRHADAVALLRRGLATFPESALIQGTLAWELATAPDASQRSGTEALALARAVAAGMPGSAQSQDLLAAALAETGDWPAAAAAAEAALAALPAGDPIAPQIQARLDLYRQRRPFRQPDGVADGR